LLLFPYTPPHPYLHSFPTRRSSDLAPPTSFVSCPAIRAFPHFRYPQAHFRPRRLLPQLLPVIFPINLVCKRPQRIGPRQLLRGADRKSTRLNSSHEWISYAVFCLKK